MVARTTAQRSAYSSNLNIDRNAEGKAAIIGVIALAALTAAGIFLYSYGILASLKGLVIVALVAVPVKLIDDRFNSMQDKLDSIKTRLVMLSSRIPNNQPPVGGEAEPPPYQ